MEVQELHSKSLEYLVLYPDGYDSGHRYPLVILLHGFGANMYDLASLAPAIDRQRYVYLCPNAPLKDPVALGMSGRAWMPISKHTTASDISKPETMITEFIEEMVALYSPGISQVVLCGFSQGGMMTYQVGLPRPDNFAGLAILSGRIANSNALSGRLPITRDLQIFIAHGTEDPIINVEEARDSKRFLQGHGYQPQYHEFDMAHGISQDVLEVLEPWIHQVLSPSV
jgi:phospholipase/carboxylesterase